MNNLSISAHVDLSYVNLLPSYLVSRCWRRRPCTPCLIFTCICPPWSDQYPDWMRFVHNFLLALMTFKVRWYGTTWCHHPPSPLSVPMLISRTSNATFRLALYQYHYHKLGLWVLVVEELTWCLPFPVEIFQCLVSFSARKCKSSLSFFSSSMVLVTA